MEIDVFFLCMSFTLFLFFSFSCMYIFVNMIMWRPTLFTSSRVWRVLGLFIRRILHYAQRKINQDEMVILDIDNIGKWRFVLLTWDACYKIWPKSWMSLHWGPPILWRSYSKFLSFAKKRGETKVCFIDHTLQIMFCGKSIFHNILQTSQVFVIGGITIMRVI